MKDSQPFTVIQLAVSKYIKESNERFSTLSARLLWRM